MWLSLVEPLSIFIADTRSSSPLSSIEYSVWLRENLKGGMQSTCTGQTDLLSREIARRFSIHNIILYPLAHIISFDHKLRTTAMMKLLFMLVMTLGLFTLSGVSAQQLRSPTAGVQSFSPETTDDSSSHFRIRSHVDGAMRGLRTNHGRKMASAFAQCSNQDGTFDLGGYCFTFPQTLVTGGKPSSSAQLEIHCLVSESPLIFVVKPFSCKWRH